MSLSEYVSWFKFPLGCLCRLIGRRIGFRKCRATIDYCRGENSVLFCGPGSDRFALTVGTCCPLGINSGLFKVESLWGFRDFGSLDCHRQISGKAEDRTSGIKGGSVAKRVTLVLSFKINTNYFVNLNVEAFKVVQIWVVNTDPYLRFILVRL